MTKTHTHVIAACVLNVLHSPNYYNSKQLPQRPSYDDKLQTGFMIRFRVDKNL